MSNLADLFSAATRAYFADDRILSSAFSSSPLDSANSSYLHFSTGDAIALYRTILFQRHSWAVALARKTNLLSIVHTPRLKQLCFDARAEPSLSSIKSMFMCGPSWFQQCGWFQEPKFPSKRYIGIPYLNCP
jgi:hypothetical protein